MKKLLFLLAAAVCFFAFGIAHPQTTPTYSATLTWTAPTACIDGAPIAQCAVLDYRLERLQGSTWVDQKTVPAGTLTTTMPANLGTNSYRIYARSADGLSPPSNAATRTFNVPNSPVIVNVTVTVTVQSP